MPEDEEQGREGAAPADGGERAEPGLGGIDDLVRRPGTARTVRQPAGDTMFVARRQLASGGCTSARRALSGRPRFADRRRRHRRSRSARPARPRVGGPISSGARRSRRAPRPRQGADLLGHRDGQGRVERPADRAAAPAGAHRSCRSGPQPVRVGLEGDDGERDGRLGGGRIHDRDRIGVGERALRAPSSAARAIPVATRSARPRTGRLRLPRRASCCGDYSLLARSFAKIASTTGTLLGRRVHDLGEARVRVRRSLFRGHLLPALR